jgi:hypothetical protein
MAASLAPDLRQVKTGQGHAAGPVNGRYATVLSAKSARRAAQLPCIALARYPDRSASGIAYLAFLATMPPLICSVPGAGLTRAGRGLPRPEAGRWRRPPARAARRLDPRRLNSAVA